ncbi:MAG TPA: ABC transporter permease [Ohtaekwangia sp.]|nr:ABC transporter permease [Ohtaekwangia sp.]
MFKNYFVVALRNITKHKFYSVINILGMTTGITACLLIILFVTEELSYDRFHVDASRIYQVGLHGKLGGQDIKTATTCSPMADALVHECPDVESATRIVPYYSEPSIKFGDKTFVEEEVIYADSNFFDFFSFQLIHGNSKTALQEPKSVVLSQALAQKYFGDEPVLGKIITIDGNENSYKVTGIVENAPSNSHFGYSMILSAASNDRLKRNEWLNNWMFTYFKLRTNGSLDVVHSTFNNMVVKYIGPELEKFMGISITQMKDQGAAYGYYATPITDIYLHSQSRDDIKPGGNVMHVYFFIGIGAFILLIACINFMNLSTARSAGRAKEVGLRKTLGSLRGQMIVQFLSESFIYSLVAVLLALIACYTLLPSFNLLTGKELGMGVFASPLFIGCLLFLVILVGLIAGSYPAFYLTSFNPVEVLKGKVRAGMKSKGVRSSLVVCQFGLSIFLIIFTSVVYQQIRFMQDKNIGLDKENILIINNTWRLHENKEAFRNALSQQSGVNKLSYTSNTFPGVNNTTIFRSGTSDQDHIMSVYYADHEHLDVMKFQLKEGRYFSRDFPSDSTGILLNEVAAKEFGFTNPVGEKIIYNNGERMETLYVIGVMKNFNFESFKSEIRPISIRLTQNANTLLVRYNGNAKAVVSSVESLWKAHANDEPFEYAFLDAEFDQLFRGEQRMGEVFTIFSGLAIFIASLGLFALAAFTSEQRTKEIGIRKAMGASSLGITLLLSKNFTMLVLIAFVPAALLGWYVSEQWLSGFAHRIAVDPLVFIFSGAAAIIIAWLTVSYQSFKAAAINPVQSLRYE